MTEFFQSDLFAWVILPVLIFAARVADVSMGTVRVVLIARGVRFLAAVVGFFEVSVWLLAITQILQRVTNPVCFFAYTLGFATGTYVGMAIEGRLKIGKVVVRVVTAKPAERLIESMRAAHYGVTSLDAKGAIGPVKLIFTIVHRRDVDAVIRLIREFDPGAFYTISDVRFVNEGVFPQAEVRMPWLPRGLRKGK